MESKPSISIAKPINLFGKKSLNMDLQIIEHETIKPSTMEYQTIDYLKHF